MNAVLHLLGGQFRSPYSKQIDILTSTGADTNFDQRKLRSERGGFFAYLNQIIDACAESSPATLVCWDPRSFVAALLARWRSNANYKIVWVAREEPSSGIMERFYRALSARLMKRAERIVFPNKVSQQRYRYSNLSSSRCAVIDDAVDHHLFSPNAERYERVRADRAWPRGSTVIGILATESVSQRGRSIASAVSSLIKEGLAIVLVFGGSGEEGQTFACLAEFQRYGLAPEILAAIEDSRDNPDFFGSLDIFFAPNANGAVLDSLIQAQLCGVPCVTYDSPETRDIVDPYGSFISDASPESMLRGLALLARYSPDERNALGVSARHAMIERFAAQRMRDQYEKLFTELNGEPEPSAAANT